MTEHVVGVTSGGVRIGKWFLWLDYTGVSLSRGRKAVVVEARSGIMGGDLLATEVANRSMVAGLRSAADAIERALDAALEANRDDAG